VPAPSIENSINTAAAAAAAAAAVVLLVNDCECRYVSVCQFKVWLKSSAEQQFLYGNHVMKSGLGRITENTQQYQGVVVYSMNDIPLVCTHAHTQRETDRQTDRELSC